MRGFFITAVLLSISAIICLGAPSVMDDQPINELMERDFFGIPIPDFIAKIPIFGQLITTGASFISNTTASVLSPAIDLVSIATSGLLSSNSPIFIMLDRMSGGLFTTLSGKGAFKAPIFDVKDLLNVGKNLTDGVTGAAATIQDPLFKLAGIPGDVIGNTIKQFGNILQSLPFPFSLFGPPKQG